MSIKHQKKIKGQAMIESCIILITLPLIMLLMANVFNYYITQIQLINGARLGTDLVIHMNGKALNVSTGDNREIWNAVRDFLSAAAKGGAVTVPPGYTGPIQGRKLSIVTGGVASRNDLLWDINVWTRAQSGDEALNTVDKVSYFEPATPDLIQWFEIVCRYRMEAPPLLRILTGSTYLEMIGRARALNDTGVNMEKNYSRS